MVTCRHRSRSCLFGASSARSDPAAAQMEARGPRRVGLGSALVSRTPATYISLQWMANVGISGVRRKEKKARLGGRQTLAVHRGAGVGQRARAAIAELIETWREQEQLCT